MTVYIGEQIQTAPPYFGEWSGTPTSYTFQWQDSLNGSSLNANVSGETRSDYIVDDDEEGRWLRVKVIASNAGGASIPVYSDWVGPVVGFVAPSATRFKMHNHVAPRSRHGGPIAGGRTW